MRILVLAAHPDDEVLGMGGTIKKMTQKGHTVKIVILATGIEARRSTNFKNISEYTISDKDSKIMKKQIEEIRQHAKKAANVLGTKKIQFLDFPDNEMDKVSNLEITKSIENIIDIFKPEKVFTHSPYDINIDHRLIYQAVITATRPNVKSNISEVYSFEIPSSTEWNFHTSFNPNVFVDISKTLNYKLKAMKMYKTEIKQFPHPRSILALESIAKRWGTVAGFKSAEAFNLVRKLEK